MPHTASRDSRWLHAAALGQSLPCAATDANDSSNDGSAQERRTPAGSARKVSKRVFA